jgi:hypothetical protein
MNRLCWKRCSAAPTTREGARRRAARVLAIGGAALAFLVLAASASAAGSGKEPPQPKPNPLWNAYPLDAPRGSGEQPPARVRRSTPTPAASSRSSGSDNGSSLLLWISLAAFGAALIAFAISWRAHVAWAGPGVMRARERFRAAGARVATRVERLLAAPEKGLTLVAQGPRLAWPERRLQALTEALHERVAMRSRRRDVRTEPVAPNDSVNGAETPEQALLRRKRAAATSEALKKLKEKNGAETREHYKQHEVGVLKAKLADPSTPRPAEKGER